MTGEGNHYLQQPIPDKRTIYRKNPMPDERHLYTQSPVTYGGTTNFTAVNVMPPGMMMPLEGQPMWPPTNVFSPAPPVADARIGQQILYPPGDRELKNSHVRNGQPTPPPFDDQRASQQVTATTMTGLYSVASSSFQLNPALSPETMYYSPPDSVNGAAPASSPSPTGGGRRKIEDPDDGDTDEEKAKRRRFLERNRVAASKCRQKKKMETQILEQKFEQVLKQRESLEKDVKVFQNEVLDLKQQLLAHARCGNPAIDQHLQQMVRTITAIKDHESDSDREEDSPPSTIDVSTAVPALASQSLSFGFDGTESSAPSSDSIEPSPTDLAPRTSDDSDSSYLNDPSFMFDPHDTTFDDFINQDE
ncbi:hypothetical protein BJX96DRAFT_25591 [Aspergillus floccosus]